MPMTESIADLDLHALSEENPRLRGLGFYDPIKQERDRVTFVGVGGIGSFAAMGAAKLGIPYVTLIDDDVVDRHNYGNQAFNITDIGEPKVVVVGRMFDASTNLRIVPERADRTYPFSGVVVSGLDSMEARAEIWEGVKLNPAVPYYIDARIGGQIVVIYALNPLDLDSIDRYERTLHSDDEGVDAPCTERGIIDVGLMVGAAITNRLRRHFTGDAQAPITYITMSNLAVTNGEWVL